LENQIFHLKDIDQQIIENRMNYLNI
jgi:hypothetical protein